MTAIEVQPDQGQGARRERSATTGGTILRLLGLVIFTAFSLFFIYLLLSDGYWPLALLIGIITILINYIFLAPSAYPMRWMSPGLAFMLLISVYPIAFTIYISFTNYGTGHLLPKVQAIEVLESRTYLPESGSTLRYSVFRNEETGEYGLWLAGPEGNGFFATVGEQFTAEEMGAGALNEDGVPASIPGWRALTRAETVRNITAISQNSFGLEDTAVQLTGRLGEAAQLQRGRPHLDVLRPRGGKQDLDGLVVAGHRAQHLEIEVHFLDRIRDVVDRLQLDLGLHLVLVEVGGHRDDLGDHR